MQKIFFTALLFFAIITNIVAQNATDISGKWKFQIDRNDMGIREKWFAKTLQDEINLPGSMPEKLKGDDVTVHTKWTGSLYDSSYYYNPYMEKYRVEGNVKLPFFLTPDKHYVGVAWYQKEVSIPSNWKNKRILLFLERPHIETTLWINNKEVGTQNSLCVPHVYDITQWVSKGKCRVSIRIDNHIKEINVGPDSHSITDQTQGNWNGIVGRMELQATPVTHFDDIQIYPDLQNKKANVKIKLVTGFNQDNVQIRLSAKSFNTGKQHVVPPVSKDFIIKEGVLECQMDLPMGENMLTWDEFDPALYKLQAELISKHGKECKTVQFGMREFKIEGKWFYVNGNTTMLRGTVENCDFPLTVYAPMSIKEWERVFRICRKYGLNHMRFHSFCPPEAAFIAADLVGFYLQPE